MKKGEVVISADVVSELVNDEGVLLCLSTGRYFGLNSTGAFVWQQLEQHGDVERAIGQVAAEYSLDEPQARLDVTNLLKELAEHGLLSWP